MNRLIRCTAIVALMLWLSPSLATQTREQTFTVGADVDAQGQVTQTQPEPGAAPQIAAVLDEAIKHWRFVPTQHDGKAAPAHTFITAKLEALPVTDGKYSLRISYVGVGPKWNRTGGAHYPDAAVRSNVNGLVVILGDFPLDGSPVVTDTRHEFEDGYGKLFAKAAKDWFLHTSYTLETVDGQPVEAHVRTYVVFELDQVNRDNGSPAPDVPYSLSPSEKTLLHQAGFTDDDLRPNSNRLLLSSVLRPSMVDTVTLQP
ncbi:hypothetical protein [Rhodanobacter sp. C03]|uniref:hypothetical protein n=1 Tax=Rhodanobacter sp. C03 TaxID=1945858 RepID=UPI0009854DD9|nr:hypothetical protein [Rhodanobacter sp. C03]OOG59277.1 hypothetical protein B0E48_00045 [Rhodanobacter sp. C03]